MAIDAIPGDDGDEPGLVELADLIETLKHLVRRSHESRSPEELPVIADFYRQQAELEAQLAQARCDGPDRLREVRADIDQAIADARAILEDWEADLARQGEEEE